MSAQVFDFAKEARARRGRVVPLPAARRETSKLTFGPVASLLPNGGRTPAAVVMPLPGGGRDFNDGPEAA